MKEKWQKLPIYGKIAIGLALGVAVVLIVKKMRKKSQ